MKNMPTPLPLTASPAPKIDWSRPQTPEAVDFGDIYFSADGGLAESRAVFLGGCNLPGAWQGREHFTVGETGFGTGLNFLACWQSWKDTAKPGARLDFISAEKYPLSRAQLQKALSAWPQLASSSRRLLTQWPGRVKGVHRLEFDQVSLTLIHDDAACGFSVFDGQVDAWFLDGFSPAKNPDMWSDKLVEQIAHLSAPGARLASFTVAGSVRAALEKAGFELQKKPGFGRKRHRLEARFTQASVKPYINKREIKPIIIGAGIAGASLARSFLRRGICPYIIDAGEERAASANPAAIVKPRLDLQDRPESRFFLASYLYALQTYLDSGAVIDEGVYQLAKTAKDLARFKKLAGQSALPAWQMCLVKNPLANIDACQASELASGQTKWQAKEQARFGALYFPRAQLIDPKAARQSFCDGATAVRARAARILQNGGRQIVLDGSGAVLAEGSHIFWAVGAGIRTLGAAQEARLKQDFPVLETLRFSRGQVSWAKRGVRETLTYGGYAIPLGKNMLLGATHDRADMVNPYELSEKDDARNFAALMDISGISPQNINKKSRASIRVTTPSTLPLIVKGQQDEYILSGLGSRGFVFAPLLADNLIGRILGEARPNFGLANHRF